MKYFFFTLAVPVSVPSAETIMEDGGSVDVCVTLSSSISSDIIVTLATSSTGATGKKMKKQISLN